MANPTPDIDVEGLRRDLLSHVQYLSGRDGAYKAMAEDMAEASSALLTLERERDEAREDGGRFYETGLEAARAEGAIIKAELEAAEIENEALRLEMLGGEDAPGYAASLSMFQVVQSFREHQATLRTLREAAESRASALEAELIEARKLVPQYAREAGEAKGRLEMSEAAGIVEGWRGRAEKAEAELERAKGALRPITMGDVRLCAGEGRLDATAVLAAVNTMLARRKADAALNGEAGHG